MKIERLVFVHENFFQMKSSDQNQGGNYHEIAFFYLMQSCDYHKITCDSVTNSNIPERLAWLPISSLVEYPLFPSFFKTHLGRLPSDVMHIVTNESF